MASQSAQSKILPVGAAFQSRYPEVKSLGGSSHSFTQLNRGKLTLVQMLIYNWRTCFSPSYMRALQSKMEMAEELYPEVDFYWCFIFNEHNKESLNWEPNHFFVSNSFHQPTIYLLDPAGNVLFGRSK